MGGKVHEQTPQVRQTMYGLRDRLGSFREGDRFLSADAVAEEYAVCRAVALKALGILVRERRLDVVQGQGYYVISRAE